MIGNKYILNGKLKDVNNQSENIEVKNSTVVYEVFTWENDDAVFFDEHYHRLLKSVAFKGLNNNDVPSKEQLALDVAQLVKANDFVKKNIRLDLVFISDNIKYYSLYFTQSIFPTSEQHKNGVKVGLCFGERNVPEAKIANSEIRKLANQKITDNNLFEILLVDSENKMTEGSRSNVFFVKGKTIYTPKTENVLNGITRQKVIELAEKNNIEIIEADIKLEDIANYDSAFLTSTSMIVLPIYNVEELKFSVENGIVEQLYSSFLKLF